MISLNGKIIPNDLAAVSPLSPGLMYGHGVFTTIRVRGGRAEFVTFHEERLVNDARSLDLAPVSAAGELRGRCDAFISAAKIADGAIKIVWFGDERGQTVEVISERPHPYDATVKARGFRLQSMTCASRVTRELSRHKTLNYLEHIRAKKAAAKAGFDEALWVSEDGVVLEGATTNIFAVINGDVVTPALNFGLLPGVARRVLLGLSCTPQVRETKVTLSMLAEAQEIFVTNALMGVMPVCGLDGREFSLVDNSVTRKLNAAFEREADGSRQL